LGGVDGPSGRLGYLVTPYGDVGTGFSDQDRAALWGEALAGTLIGQVVEVSCMEFTPDGKFRHPRFLRVRHDKPATECVGLAHAAA
jgi:ATP-dependent DNA ligase